jgi:hypothetical protein
MRAPVSARTSRASQAQARTSPWPDVAGTEGTTKVKNTAAEERGNAIGGGPEKQQDMAR